MNLLERPLPPIFTSRNILIVGPSWLGDMVMAQSVFKLLKLQYPNAQIDVLAPAWPFAVLKRMPEVRAAIEMPILHGEVKLTQRYRLARQLKAAQYDQAIILANSFKSALIPWLAGIPLRTGWLGEMRYILLNDYRCNKNQFPLMVEQYAALAFSKEQLRAFAGKLFTIPYPCLKVSKEMQEKALRVCNLSTQAQPVLALCPGAAFGSAKCWPPNYFAEVANQKIAEGWTVWIFGSVKDQPVINQIMELTNNRCENLSGRIDLATTVDLLSIVSTVLTNDSGLMHIAAALNKPLVALYGSTSPSFTPPLGERAEILKLDLPCQPCFARECPLKHHQCMQELKPAMVLDVMQTWKN